MSLINHTRYLYALATNGHEEYSLWARGRCTKPKEFHDGFFSSTVTMPDGRVGQACVAARNAHDAREIVLDNLARSALAYVHGIDNTSQEACWVTFMVIEPELDLAA